MLLEYVYDVSYSVVYLFVELAYLPQLGQSRAFTCTLFLLLLVGALQILLDHHWSFWLPGGKDYV